VTLKRELTITNETRNLSLVRTTVSEVLDASPFDQNMRNKIIVAVDEALANVVEHAYEGSVGDIVVSLELTTEQLRVLICDNGVQFNPGERLNSTIDIHDHIRKGLKGGLGLFLMRQIMDEVRFAQDSEWVNELVMIKNLPSADETPEGKP
jgi:anti-sigma regulatory factor (Ser/Thr protein kinase)